MMPLPIVFSIPHAGLLVPPEVRKLNLLKPEQIIEDGDESADLIYFPLMSIATECVVTDIARAYVDLNRAPEDIRKDGVVKTHTIFNEPIYSDALPPHLIQRLVAKYHAPYFEELQIAATKCKLGIDCHTMAATSPPIATEPGIPRPRICLSDGHGNSCDPKMTAAFAECLNESFSCDVSINDPFQGGYISRSKPGGIPWLQLEISRDNWIEPTCKRLCLRLALMRFAEHL